MRPLVLRCALATVLVICISPVRAWRKCGVGIFRVTGKDSLFVLACRCDGMPEYIGRVRRVLDPDTPDTRAQERVTVNCIERRAPGMARACQSSGRAFEHRAGRDLRICMDKRPENPTENGLKPFTYRQNMCSTEFRELGKTAALLVCGCLQRPGYLVHPGAIQFSTTGSPNGEDREQRILRQCTREAFPSLEDACTNMPMRFDVRAAQAFNVCCKRARTKFDLEKLKCQATVPDDISEIGLLRS